MKLLVFSDSHGHIERMSLAVKQAAPDVVLHLGDNIGDARKLSAQLPNTAVYMVKGNCDSYAIGDLEQTLCLEGAKIYMAHGHMYNVKMGLTSFVYRAQETGADIALYGHTHVAALERLNGLWLMNPGQMKRHDRDFAATYGIISLKGGKIDIKLKNLP